MIFNSGNTQLNFFMPPCLEKDEIYKIIEENGGKTLKEDRPGCIYLLPYEPNFTLKEYFSHPVYSYTLILHSFSLQEMQELESYHLNPQAKPVTSHHKLSYTEKEDLEMKEFVEKTQGNPKNMSFWVLFKSQNPTTRTADSLRAHWKFLSANQVTSKKTKKIPAFKQILLDRASKQQKNPAKSLQSATPDGLGDCLTDETLKNEQSAKVSPKTESFDVEKCFDDLVDAVSHLMKRRVPPTEILDVLVECSGNVKATLAAFKSKNR